MRRGQIAGIVIAIIVIVLMVVGLAVYLTGLKAPKTPGIISVEAYEPELQLYGMKLCTHIDENYTCTPSNTVYKLSEPVYLYYEAVGLYKDRREAGYNVSFSVDVNLISPDGTVFEKSSGKDMTQGSKLVYSPIIDPAVPIKIMITPEPENGPGEYTIESTLHDLNAGTSSSKKIKFYWKK